MTEKTDGYTAIPFEDSQVPSERELPPYSEKPRYTGPQTIYIDSNHECCHQNRQQRRKAWRRALIAVLILFLGGRFLLAGLSFFMYNNFDDDQYIWVQVPGFGPHRESDIGSPEMPYNAPPRPPSPPETCEPNIKWNGPSELLLDPRDVTGLLFSVKGISARGSVIIRQDSTDQSFINVTNKIYLSEDTLQKQVDIKIDIIDEDYSVTVESPSFDGPRPTQKCVQVDTIITIPKNIRHFRSLVVDVPNSWILTENLGAIDFAYVNLRTRNGHIRTEDLSAGIAEVSTVNGHVQGGYIVSESLDVRTVNGAIGINTVINTKADGAAITVKSINGHLDIAVLELGEKQVLNLRAGSVNGGATATVPDLYHGEFSVSTLIGYSYVEGKDITYVKKTRNVKVGYKGDRDDNDDNDDDDKKKARRMHKRMVKKHCRHGHKGRDGKTSSINVEAVTGAVELYFAE